MNLTRKQYERIKSAYRTMATVAKYRPAAPSDGFGNITVSGRELDLEKEADRYAAEWSKEENGQNFRIGVCYADSRAALIYAIEAARELCSGENRVAASLLRLAQLEVRMIRRQQKKEPADFLRS